MLAFDLETWRKTDKSTMILVLCLFIWSRVKSNFAKNQSSTLRFNAKQPQKADMGIHTCDTRYIIGSSCNQERYFAPILRNTSSCLKARTFMFHSKYPNETMTHPLSSTKRQSNTLLPSRRTAVESMAVRCHSHQRLPTSRPRTKRTWHPHSGSSIRSDSEIRWCPHSNDTGHCARPGLDHRNGIWYDRHVLRYRIELCNGSLPGKVSKSKCWVPHLPRVEFLSLCSNLPSSKCPVDHSRGGDTRALGGRVGLQLPNRLQIHHHHQNPTV